VSSVPTPNLNYAPRPVSGEAHASPSRSSVRKHVAFAVVAAILALAAIGMRSTVASMELTFRKLPVDPRQPLIAIPGSLGPWLQLDVDKSLNPDIEHALGTRQYVFRDYLDTRRLSDADAARLRATPVDKRIQLIQNGQVKVDWSSTIRFALTYYTGSADTVPHVSERCFAADGWIPSSFEVVRWPVLPRAAESDRYVDVRLTNFEDQIGSRAFRPRQVAYFFQVNGQYEHDPIFGVRKKLSNLFDRHAYFAKIELVTGLDNTAAAAPVIEDFLAHAMPHVEAVLPDWDAVTKADGSATASAAAPAASSAAAR
jgi:hypothetical protein